MPIENFELVGSYNNQRFPNIDAERTINMFEYIDLKGKKPKSLISTSGILNTDLVFTGSTGGFRAEFVLNEYEYFVIGSDIWRRDQFDTLTKLNSSPIATTSGYVGVDANNNPNGEQILFVDGIRGYVWDTGTNQFTPNLALVDPAFPVAPIDVCFLDGFLVVANAGAQLSQIPTNTFQLSALNNVYSWGLVANTFTADPGPGPFADTLIVSTVMRTGMQFQITVGGVIPPPLVAATTYYAIYVDDTHIRVATSFTNALSNIFIDITAAGTPPNTITNGGIIAS